MSSNEIGLRSHMATEGAANRSHQAIMTQGQQMQQGLSQLPEQFMRAQGAVQGMRHNEMRMQLAQQAQEQQLGMAQQELQMRHDMNQVKIASEQMQQQLAQEQLAWAEALHNEDMLNAQRRQMLASAMIAERNAELQDLEIERQKMELGQAKGSGMTPEQMNMAVRAYFMRPLENTAAGFKIGIGKDGRTMRTQYLEADDPERLAALEAVSKAKAGEQKNLYAEALYDRYQKVGAQQFAVETGMRPTANGFAPIPDDELQDIKRSDLVRSSREEAINQATQIAKATSPGMLEILAGAMVGDEFNFSALANNDAGLKMAEQIQDMYLANMRLKQNLVKGLSDDDLLMAGGLGKRINPKPEIEVDTETGQAVLTGDNEEDKVAKVQQIQQELGEPAIPPDASFKERDKLKFEMRKARGAAAASAIYEVAKANEYPTWHNLLKNAPAYKREANKMPSEWSAFPTSVQQQLVQTFDRHFQDYWVKTGRVDIESLTKTDFGAGEVNPLQYAEGGAISRPEQAMGRIASVYSATFAEWLRQNAPAIIAQLSENR